MDSSLGDIINTALQRNVIWGEVALDRVRLFVYDGMQLFAIFMAAFFFLFLYYCTFGFVVESIAESNMEESVTKVENAPAAEREGGAEADEVKADAELRDKNKHADKADPDMGFGLYD